jgi:KaiC/GvpD/RAD55 family RecA-like ATPase
VDARSLYEHFPWIKEQIPIENVVDATKNIIPKKVDFTYVIDYSSLPDFLKGLYSITHRVSQQQTPLIVVDSIDALAANVKMPVEEVCSMLVNFAENMQSQIIFVTERHGTSMIDYMVDGVIRLERKFIKNRLVRKMTIEKLRGVEIGNPVYYFTLQNGKFQYFKNFQHIIG